MRTVIAALFLIACGEAREFDEVSGERSDALGTNVSASADATVRDGTYAVYPQGALSTLELKTEREGWNRQSYLRFDITAMPATGGSAMLYLYGSFVGSGPPVLADVWGVSDHGWNESTLTWNDRPEYDAGRVAAARVSGGPEWYKFDLTSYVRARKDAGEAQIDLLLMGSEYNGALASFNSKESRFNVPSLVLSTENDNVAPTVATAASATPASTFVVLRALGADDTDEANLTYTWAVIDGPTAPVRYGNENGYNQGQQTFAYFASSGTYTFRVTIADTQGASVTSDVTVELTQRLHRVVMVPESATLRRGETLQIVATALDRYDNPLLPAPVLEWSAWSGTVTQEGLYTAGQELGGPTYVSARTGTRSGSTAITVVP